MVAAAERAPPTARTSELNAVVQAASKSLYATAIYEYGVESSRYEATVATILKAGYAIFKAAQLPDRPPWLTERSTVFCYDNAAKSEALFLAQITKQGSWIDTGVSMGAGLGIPKGREQTSLRVHLVRW